MEEKALTVKQEMIILGISLAILIFAFSYFKAQVVQLPTDNNVATYSYATDVERSDANE